MTILDNRVVFTADGEFFMRWSYKGHSGNVPVGELQGLASILVAAAVTSEAEARIARTVASNLLRDEPPGPALQRKRDEFLAALLGTIRESRQREWKGVNAIYGARTRKPLVQVDWYGESILWEPTEAIDHAMLLLECAHSAKTDWATIQMLMGELGMSKQKAIKLVGKILDYREALSQSS